MHESVMRFVQSEVTRRNLEHADVLDVGALDVNGCVRHMFDGGYVAVDMRPGPNVDHVCNAHHLCDLFEEGQFDAVVCCEMLEHDDEFWTSMRQMARVLKPGGRMILTTRGIGFPLHEHPDDLWRFTESAGRKLAEMAGLHDVTVLEDPQAPGIFVTGEKA